MRNWHCGTTHCRGGWAIVECGSFASELEAVLGPQLVAGAIYYASTGSVPDFFADNETALRDIRECAAAEVRA